MSDDVKDESGPPPLPKRFYETVTLEEGTDGLQVMLDGRAARTPARRALATPHRALADAIASEWQAQGDRINPVSMPHTQRRMLVIDRAEADTTRWADGVRAYLASDLLCYRAAEPEGLVERQAAEWTPYLDWARDALAIPLTVTRGIMAVDQPEAARAGLDRQLEGTGSDELACLAAATEISGSAVLALALWHGRATPEEIFSASRLDERWQAEQWGLDSEAEQREKRLEAEFLAVAAYLKAVS